MLFFFYGGGGGLVQPAFYLHASICIFLLHIDAHTHTHTRTCTRTHSHTSLEHIQTCMYLPGKDIEEVGYK